METTSFDTPSQHLQRLNIINPGFTRNGITPFASPIAPPLEVIARMRDGGGSAHTHPPDPWETLQWWESPWQAKIGVRMLTHWPFLRINRSDKPHQLIVPTRVFYPYALRSTDEERVERTAYTIAASVRQAREMYTAAQTVGVSDLSRPLLYFYGALGLAEAATAALLGADSPENSHGLITAPGATMSSEQPLWPTLIQWRDKGQFPMLYRTTRWDTLYACCEKDSRTRKIAHKGTNKLPKFHILECIRALGYSWGTLPSTGLAPSGTALYGVQRRQVLLLPYRDQADMFMTNEMSLTTPLMETPRVLLQYMLLYYFSILARYHTVEWQRLLAADREPEGYVFRMAMEQVAQDYLYEIACLLPNTLPLPAYGPEEWSDARPSLEDWYDYPSEVVDTAQVGGIKLYRLREWEGTPADTCSKAQKSFASGSVMDETHSDL